MWLPSGVASDQSDSHEPATLSELVAWLQASPPGVMVPALTLGERLQKFLDDSRVELAIVAPKAETPTSWRERLWTCPVDTRLGVPEVAEALGRPRSWVYRRTGVKSKKARLPHRQLDGELVFTAGELRRWIESHETKRTQLMREPSR